ncbi:MAG: 5'-nucleotidase C-terminal domain-containing protein [Nitrospirae bacterium]|nr:5'-nucleotidase C-terminal domain-containing protein [Nitrospirota bacterium]
MDNVIAEDPYLQLGGDMIRFSGMEIKYNTKKPLGERIKIVKIGGKSFDPKAMYKVVSAAGQIQNHPKGINKKDTGKVAVETLIDYIKKNSPISSKLDDRIKEDK